MSWHTQVFWKDSILIQTQGASVLVNPLMTFSESTTYLLDEENDCSTVVLTSAVAIEKRQERENRCSHNGKYCHIMLEDGAVAEVNGIHCIYHDLPQAKYLVINYDGLFVLYDDGIENVEQVEKESYDLVIFKLKTDIKPSIMLAKHLRPRVGIPV